MQISKFARKTDPNERRKYANYVNSAAWKKRRQAWFAQVRASGFEPACWVCGARLDKAGTLDLHHRSYDGVSKAANGRWVSNEAHDDLVPLCRADHQALHEFMDSRGWDYRGWSRTDVTNHVLRVLRSRKKK